MPKPGHKKINRPSQDGYEITLDAENKNVNKVWIRFGKSDGKDKYKWDHTVAMEQIALKKGVVLLTSLINAYASGVNHAVEPCVRPLCQGGLLEHEG